VRHYNIVRLYILHLSPLAMINKIKQCPFI